jgi:hypothetical protein
LNVKKKALILQDDGNCLAVDSVEHPKGLESLMSVNFTKLKVP